VKVLGLDVGDVRIGLAVAEEEQGFAFGRGWLVREGNQRDQERIVALAREEGVQRIVIGLPLHSDGGEGKQAVKVRAFAKELERSGIPLEFVDERFTTYLAVQRLAHLPKSKREEKGRRDEAAAIAILETYLGLG